MLNLIYSEFLKLKRSYIIAIVLLGGSIMPLFMNLIIFIMQQNERKFENYVYNIEQISLLILYVILLSLIVGYVFGREYSDKTANTLYAYPISRIKIFMGKLIIVYILITIIYFIQIIVMYIGAYMIYGILEKELIIINLKANICSLLFQFMLVPIPVLVANVSKNNMITTSYGIVNFIITAMMADSKFLYSKYNPLMTPYLSFKYFYYPDYVDINTTVGSGIICFVIAMSVCIYQYNKTDIIC